MFRGAQKLSGGLLRSWHSTHSECSSNLVKILIQILRYPRLIRILFSKFGVKTNKTKKRSSSQNCRLLDHVHFIFICLVVSKKSVSDDLFPVNVCWSVSSGIKVYYRLGGTSSDLRGTSPKCPRGAWA